ncbi:MAG: SMP-30/gluconolactonase/LRE family protein [Pirellulales bacterium]
MKTTAMKITASLTLVLLFVGSLAAANEIPTIGKIGEPVEVAAGFKFTEGPASDGQGNLYFTDIPENKIHKLTAEGQVEVFTDESGHANGLMFNAAGELLACEMDGQLVAWNIETKQRRVVADQYNGKRFNACNDLVVDSAGGVYFTDPSFRAPDPWPQGKLAVYYVDRNGKVARLIDDLPNPNGVILSPDEKTLYVIPTGQAEMMAYPVESPGKIGAGKVFCKLQQKPGEQGRGGDGLAVDTKGNLYITSGLGLQVFNPQGELLGIIALPQQPANVTFTGEKNNVLAATCRTAVYTVETEATGHVFPGE